MAAPAPWLLPLPPPSQPVTPGLPGTEAACVPGTAFLASPASEASSPRWRKGVTRRRRPAQARCPPRSALRPRYGGGAAGAGPGPAVAVPVRPAAGEAARAWLRGRVGGVALHFPEEEEKRENKR
ncbi:uncharacterized protein LOC134514251 isoform X2 [Chroicocephalus ridibundus]|uniref:uncharacterized protein LOC134514251 isoform X2 n=1 Tax=Chroicocephalus ridibundus TaxID=1192867 RepID=UPI002FDD2BC0